MIAPNGSRWWAWGEHYEVVGQTERDNEPAVMIKNVTKKGAKPRSIITRLLNHHGVRMAHLEA